MGLLGSLIKTAVDTVTIPLDVVKDVVTLGGAVNDDKSAIVSKIETLDKDLDNILKDIL